MGFLPGLTVFVPLSAAGDLLTAEIAEIKGKTAFARIVEILRPSNDRTDPGCLYFGVCGGCDFQHLNYQAQLEAKTAIVRDCLKRIGKLEGEPAISMIPSPQPYGYRIRTQVHADPVTRTIGFYKRQSHDVIEADHCPILVPELDETVRDIRKAADWDALDTETVDIEASSSGGISSVYAEGILDPTETLTFEALGSEYRFTARTFFQANRYMVEPLIDAATAGPGGRLAIDLYCGIGLFTVPLAVKFERAVGVENSSESVSLAKINARASGRENAEFYDSRVRAFLDERAEELAGPDLVLVDPPRSGVKKPTLDRIIGLAPGRINYVSCNPSTLARDVRILIDGGYEIEDMTALDLFPQTHHVEAVVRMKRSA